MRLDLAASEDWDRVAAALRPLTGTADEETPHPHPGLAAAVVEWTLGLAQVFSHKRSVAYVKGNSHAYDHVIPWFLKETYNVQTAAWSDLDTEDKAVAWIQSLKKDTAFVMTAEDHPVTGALENADVIDRLANEQKFFSFRVSHSAFLTRAAHARPYSVRLCSVDEALAVSFAGSRLRVPPLFSQKHPWSVDEVTRRWLARRAAENRDAVVAFEAGFDSHRWFPANSTERLFDRAVLAFDDVSGEALLTELQRRDPSLAPGRDVDTPNLCHWDSTRLLKSWWSPPPPEEKQRGMVVFDAAVCARKDFAPLVRAVYEDIKRQSLW